MQSFDSLSEKEILALAIGQEEQDARIYGEFADGLKDQYPKTAEVFLRMREEEDGHRRRLIELFQQKFGEHIPLVRREDVKGMIRRRPFWRVRPLGLETVRKEAALMELETRRFYEKSAARTSDASVRQLLGDLASEERGHENLAGTLEKEVLTPDARAEEAETARRLFVLQVVQPGLAGLMDGSVSTLTNRPIIGTPCSSLSSSAAGNQSDASIGNLVTLISASETSPRTTPLSPIR